MEIKVEREDPTPPPVTSVTLTLSVEELRVVRRALYESDWSDSQLTEDMFRKIVQVMYSAGIPCS